MGQPVAPDGVVLLVLHLMDPAMHDLVLVLLLLHSVALSINVAIVTPSEAMIAPCSLGMLSSLVMSIQSLPAKRSLASLGRRTGSVSFSRPSPCTDTAMRPRATSSVATRKSKVASMTRILPADTD